MFPDVVALFSKNLEAEYQQFMREHQHNWLIYGLPVTGSLDQRAACPCCHFSWGDIEQALTYFKYCPNCGKPMMESGATEAAPDQSEARSDSKEKP